MKIIRRCTEAQADSVTDMKNKLLNELRILQNAINIAGFGEKGNPEEAYRTLDNFTNSPDGWKLPQSVLIADNCYKVRKAYNLGEFLEGKQGDKAIFSAEEIKKVTVLNEKYLTTVTDTKHNLVCLFGAVAAKKTN